MINKTSDINVVNIEEDIKILNNFCEFEDAVVLTDYALTLVQEAIINILAEREQKDKRIQELEEENAILKKASNIAKDVNIEDVTEVMNKSFEEFMSDYISKQVVIDKMEELNKEIKNGDEIEAIFKIKQQQILQELLERGNK